MALYDHIVACNTHSLAGRRPFHVAGVQVGWVSDDIAERMTRWREYFAISKDSVAFRDSLNDVETRSKALAEAGLEAKRIAVSAAFHSELVAPAAQPFQQDLMGLPFGSPDIPCYSNVTAER